MAPHDGKIGPVTLAELIRSVNRLIEKFEEHIEKHLQLGLILDRLEQSEKRRDWHIRAVWVALVGGLIAWLFHGLQ